MLYEVITVRSPSLCGPEGGTCTPCLRRGGRGADRSQDAGDHGAGGGVITSYSIHYTKLYDLVVAVEDLGGYAWPILLDGLEGGEGSEPRQEDESDTHSQDEAKEEDSCQEKRFPPGTARNNFV